MGGLCRFITITGVVVSVLHFFALSAAEIDKTATVHFDIPEMRADKALTLFAEQAQVTFIFPYREAMDRSANELKGIFALEEGLRILLRGSGLQAAFDKEHGIAVTALSGDTRIGEKYMGNKKLKSGSFLNRLAAGITAVFSLNSAVPAEDNPGAKQIEIQEIIVTARYREERPQDIGASIKAVSGRELERAGITDFEDIAYRTVGLDMLDRGPNQNEISIRGISKPVGAAAADTFTANPVVTLFLDDIPVTTDSGNQRDFNFFDFNRVEVLRGPQPTLFGEGSVGGTIRYFSNDPSLENRIEGIINTSVSTAEDGGNNKLVQAAIGVTLIENILGFRLTGYSRDDDGFIDNILLNKDDANDFERSGGRAILLFEPNNQLSARLFAHFGRDESGEQWGVNPMTSPDDLESSIPVAGSVDDDFDLYGLKLDYKPEKFTLTSITGQYERERESSLFDPNFTGQVQFLYGSLFLFGEPVLSSPVTVRNLTFDEESFTQEFRFVTDFEGPLNFISGIFYQDSDFTSDLAAIAPGIAPFTFMNSDLLTGGKTTFDTEQLSAFVEATFEVTDSFRIIAGVRYVNEEKTANFDPNSLAHVPSLVPLNINPVFPLVTGPALASVGLSTKFDFKLDKFLPHMAIEWNITGNSLLYMNLAKGARNGNINPAVSAATQALGFGLQFNEVFRQLITYDEDEVTAYEIGLKSSLFEDSLILNSALFLNHWKKIQTITGSPALITNNADAESYGIEVEATWYISPNLTVFTNGNYTQAEFTDDVVSASIRDGNNLSGVPDYSLSMGFDGTYPLSDTGWNFIYHFDYQYIDERFSAANNFANTQLDSLELMNLRLGFTNDQLTFTGFVNNLTNEIEIQALNVLNSSLPPLETFVNRPRTIGLSLTYSF